MSAHPLVSKCGINCATCPIHLAPVEGRLDWLERAAERFRCKPGDIFCDGCGGDINRRWTDDKCAIIACQEQRGFEYCKGCADFPCDTVASKQPEGLRRIHEIGAEAFLAEGIRRQTCPACGRLALISDKACHTCGASLPREQ